MSFNRFALLRVDAFSQELLLNYSPVSPTYWHTLVSFADCYKISIASQVGMEQMKLIAVCIWFHISSAWESYVIETRPSRSFDQQMALKKN